MGMPSRKDFVDPADGWFDIGGFLDQAYASCDHRPITSRRLGTGSRSLVFVNRRGEPAPNSTRGPTSPRWGPRDRERTRGAFAAKPVAGSTAGCRRSRDRRCIGKLDVYPSRHRLRYTADARASSSKASTAGQPRGGRPPLFLRRRHGELRYAGVHSPDSSTVERPAFRPVRDPDLRPAQHYFTPTSGYLLDLSGTAFAEAIGATPSSSAQTSSARRSTRCRSAVLRRKGNARWSSDGTPFYCAVRPAARRRGDALPGRRGGRGRGRGPLQLHPRFSLVAFGGAERPRARSA